MSDEKMVRSIELKGGEVLVNGTPFPYYIDAQGPLVEAVNEYVHILWLPVLAQGLAPRLGPPDGEPLDIAQEATGADLRADQTSGEGLGADERNGL